MKNYDILVVGASTTGCWFAERMAREGFKVLVIEKEQSENVSRSYDIFHMSRAEMEQFELYIPGEDEAVREFSFDSSPMISPYGNYPKQGGSNPIIGLHKHDYIMLMAQKAKESGAEILYGASFSDFVYDENNKIIGAEYVTEDGKNTVYSKLVADCSGIPSAARTKLPDTSVVENFKLTPKDILYVVLYYVKYLNEELNPRDYDGFFMQYKSWSAPAGEGYSSILGIGASYSYAVAEEIFNSQFIKNVKFNDYTVKKVEKGMTPYHRSLYSFVDDGFIAMGDAAFLTKPTCGEGCTSSLVQAQIAAEVLTRFLKEGVPLTKENMWCINKKYMTAQGKDFDSMRPLLMGLVQLNFDEAEYLFENDIMFSQKILGGMNDGLQLGGKDIADIVKGIAEGVTKKKIRASAVGKVVKGLEQCVEVGMLYDKYPQTADGFDAWKKKADALWNRIGSLADTCDPEVLKRVGVN